MQDEQLSNTELKTTYPDFVPPELNANSKYLLVAEAPGEVEVEVGRPLVGPTGQFVNSFLEVVKLPRTWFDITNVVQHRPPENNLMLWLENEDERVKLGREALASLLASRKYDGILALGWFALLNLVGKRGISEHRGSIYRMENGTPVLGTYHPAILFEEPKLANVIFRDFFKFRKMVTDGVPEPMERNLVTFPTHNDFAAWVHRMPEFNTCMAVDIEADPKTKELTEVGFAWSATDAITIKMNEQWAAEAVQWILGMPKAKVFHNASFDVPFLEYNLGWEVNGDLHDTLLMHHTIYPEFPADLGFCASLYTDEPYWKDLGGSEDESLRQRYNALDVAVTAELFEKLKQKLNSLGLWATYERDRAVIRPAIEMSKLGIKYDFEEHKRLRDRMRFELGRWQRVLNARAKRACIARGEQGKAKWLLTKLEKEDLNVMSPLQAPALLYDVLGLPVQYQKDKKKGKKRVTTSQMKLLNLYPNISSVEAKKTLRALLHCRRIRKMLSTYLTEDTLCGEDGRIRTTFGVGRTETGRWTASEFLIDQEGANLQTVPPEWKTCFIADEGKDMFYADYSQIEARIVAYDAEDLDQIAVFERGGDIHRENAARMVKKDPKDVTDDERQYMGKTVHALNYKVGADTLAESINKHGLETGIFISKVFTSAIRQMYLNTYDRVVRWQRRQWATVKETGVLVNHLGRRRIFTGPKKGQFAHVTEGEAIAFVPQSDVPDLLNLAILAISKDPIMRECGVQLLLQVHDALLGQGDSDKKHIWVPRLRELMTIPLTIRGRQCIVPTDIKVGQNWKSMTKYKGEK